jgi:cellulose 1,4-beta-cellobiosidase
MEREVGWSPKNVIDTGRNGVDNMRQDCANWCNIRGAGVGHRPTTRTHDENMIDAYLWLKTPGESDGCTSELPNGNQCARYDSFCGS